MFIEQFDELGEVGKRLGQPIELLVRATLPQKPAGYHYHFVTLALMLANEERADFDMALPLGAWFARERNTRAVEALNPPNARS